MNQFQPHDRQDPLNTMNIEIYVHVWEVSQLLYVYI